ncbi:MAG: diaminopimelate decarboxylase [Pirellulales bacterium]|nr:diaminopimelate decarboxylase [Pirellulales bacterium]
MPEPPSYPTIRTHIAGLPVAELAGQFGTPVYVYDAATIRRRLADLAAFDCVRYAVKACSNLAILDLLRREGAVVDTVSSQEVRRALAAGYEVQGTPPPIVYTADIFDAASLELVVGQGVHVNCGSPDMIDQYGRLAPGREITLRINPGFGHGHSQKTNTGGDQSKHGIWHEQLGECLEKALKYDLRVTGLHVHIGSGCDMEHLSQICDAMERLARQAGPMIHSVSTGGGVPIPYHDGEAYVDLDAYFSLWDSTRKRLEETFGHPVRLEIEPGRYLVAESGYLIAEIRAVKKQGQNCFYLVDAGFNNLARPILYGAYHPISIVPHDGVTDRPEQDVVVGGPLCESGDIFTQEEGGYVARRRLPEAAVGDWLVIECAGAYCASMGSNYNSRPMAAEVLIDDGQAALIRRRQSFDEIVAGETIPKSS